MNAIITKFVARLIIPTPVGRWKITTTTPIVQSATPLGIKTCDINCIDRANEDHCGPCGNVNNVERSGSIIQR